MIIKVRLFATLREGRGKEIMMELEKESTVTEVISELNIAQNDVAILLINGRDGKFDTALTVGDVVSIFPPVGGG